ncbi:MAG: PD-(D/E)XK nuclease family protein, partial [Nitrococcus sp.]|nr:PD-(D/E)XK nuclease family protein [Nitrococcus sp.]
RIDQAPRLLGPITLRGVLDLDPVWRPLLLELTKVIPVRWEALPELRPQWARNGAGIVWEEGAREVPQVTRVSCANPRHAALEALRWARGLLATGQVRPEEVAIAAPTTAEWEGHISVIAADAELPVAFAGGRPALTSGDGQAAAALAEILLKGLSRGRVHRLLSLIHGQTPMTAQITPAWRQMVPNDAPLLHLQRWRSCLASAGADSEGQGDADGLLAVLEQLDRGLGAAAATGELLLAGRALAIWRKALRDGPARALDVTRAGSRIDAAQEPAVASLYGSAADLAACPRPYVWLLGLTSRGWPRARQEDALLPAHVVEPTLLDPVSLTERDRRDFQAILRTSAKQLVLCRARRDAEGRDNGESPLLRIIAAAGEKYLRRERAPEHAVSESDRVLAGPEEFVQQPRARSARSCWVNWHLPRLTAHDGLLRADHPVLRRALQRPLSATRLRALVRDPLGFVWRHVLGWEAPVAESEPLVLDAQVYGNLAHRVLERALVRLEQEGGLAGAVCERVAHAIDAALATTVAEYELNEPVPPRILWRRTQREMRHLAMTALTYQESPLAGQCSFAEVAFGGGSGSAKAAQPAPWDAAATVRIPHTDLTITGQIDRLDLAADRSAARVTDYKTGKSPAPNKPIVVRGGAELQRCLYAFAAQALLGPRLEVEARLLYPGAPAKLLSMEAPRERLEEIAQYLVAARDHLLAGNALPGPGSAEFESDPLRFVLPGNAKAVYLETKRPLAALRLAPLPELWELP